MPMVPLGEPGDAPRCPKVARFPLYRIEQVELAPSGAVPMRDIGATDLHCVHAQGHRGPHLGYYYGNPVAWSNDGPEPGPQGGAT